MGKIDKEGAEAAERGWALVSVLWAVAILSMMAAATEALTVTSARMEHHALTHARADAALDAGVIRAILAIASPDLSERWPVDGTVQSFTFDGIAMNVAIQDELGRIDLNAANEPELHQLLTDAGMDNDDATALVDKILDWRSVSQLHRLHGATDEDYAAAGYGYRQRHGPFQTVDELKLVMGMKPDIFRKSRPALTVYSKRSAIDPNVASREALLAYYGGNTQMVDKAIEMRESRNRDTSGLSNKSPANVVDVSMPLSGRAFTIAVTIRAGRQRFERETAIEFTGGNNPSYLVLAWR